MPDSDYADFLAIEAEQAARQQAEAEALAQSIEAQRSTPGPATAQRQALAEAEARREWATEGDYRAAQETVYRLRNEISFLEGPTLGYFSGQGSEHPPADRRRWGRAPGFDPSTFMDIETGDLYSLIGRDRYEYRGNLARDPTLTTEVQRRAAIVAAEATRSGLMGPADPIALQSDRYAWDFRGPKGRHAYTLQGALTGEGAINPTGDDVARYMQLQAQTLWYQEDREKVRSKKMGQGLANVAGLLAMGGFAAAAPALGAAYGTAGAAAAKGVGTGLATAAGSAAGQAWGGGGVDWTRVGRTAAGGAASGLASGALSAMGAHPALQSAGGAMAKMGAQYAVGPMARTAYGGMWQYNPYLSLSDIRNFMAQHRLI